MCAVGKVAFTSAGAVPLKNLSRKIEKLIFYDLPTKKGPRLPRRGPPLPISPLPALNLANAGDQHIGTRHQDANVGAIVFVELLEVDTKLGSRAFVEFFH